MLKKTRDHMITQGTKMTNRLTQDPKFGNHLSVNNKSVDHESKLVVYLNVVKYILQMLFEINSFYNFRVYFILL